MAVSNLPNELWLKGSFFEVTSLHRFVCNFHFYASRHLFWKPNIPMDSFLTSRIQFWTQIIVLTNRWKFHILDNFTPRVENSDLELESGCDCTESTVGLIWEVGTQILNLLWVLVMFDTILIFLKKKCDLKIWFFKLNFFYKIWGGIAVLNVL